VKAIHQVMLYWKCVKFDMKHTHWCSKYNIYKYSQSQPTHLYIILFR
jgi:hypothetical protein